MLRDSVVSGCKSLISHCCDSWRHSGQSWTKETNAKEKKQDLLECRSAGCCTMRWRVIKTETQKLNDKWERHLCQWEGMPNKYNKWQWGVTVYLTTVRSTTRHPVLFLPIKTFPNRDVDFGKPFYSMALWLEKESALNAYWHPGLTCKDIIGLAKCTFAL